MSSMNHEPSFRLAKDEDLQPLSEFARQTFAQAFGDDMDSTVLADHLQEHMSDEVFAAHMQEDLFLLSHEQGVLVGFVQVGTVSTDYAGYVDAFDAQASEIKRLYVLSIHQGSGLGSALLTAGLQAAKPSHCVYLTTWEANLGAQRLYQRFGFAKVGQIPEYDPNGEMNGYEYIMQRPA